MYVDDFLLAPNTITTLNAIKKLLAKEYNMKNLGKVKIIIAWQVTRDIVAHIMKIDQSALIRDLVIKKRLTKYNVNVILIKARSSIKMLEPNDYNETDIHMYQ